MAVYGSGNSGVISQTSNGCVAAIKGSAQQSQSTKSSGTGISFTSPDTIADSNSSFGWVNVGTMIEVSGSASNNYTARVLTAAAGTLTIATGKVTTESAGGKIEVRPA